MELNIFVHRMLQKRENEIRRRREHVEKLLKWHQRLDVEEREVIKMEQMIMYISTSDAYQTTSHEQINDTVAITVHHRSKRTNCQRNEDSSMHERSLANVTDDTLAMERTRFEHKKQKQIYKIEKSLNTLKMISSHSISSDIDGSNVDDTVEVYGRQLNKLWKRLTGQQEEKFTPDKVYSLAKSDLELLYEQAKSVVLKQFHANEEFKRRLIDNSVSIIGGTECNDIPLQKPIEENPNQENVEKHSEQDAIVPALSLASSPEPKENIISDTDQGYYFSNSNNEQISTEQHETQQQQPTQHETQSVDTATLDAMSENLESSRIQTEEQIQEDDDDDDDETASLPEDVQSDITEDSLNKPKSLSGENVLSPSEIQTVSYVNESQADESDKSIQIESATESNQASRLFSLNLSNNNIQLIEETSFPNIEIQTTISSVVESDISIQSHSSMSPIKNATLIVSSQPFDEQKYQSDDFEEERSADELTSISTATVTKIATTPTVTTATTNQSPEKSVATNAESSKELEQRLISIDDALKEISEQISKSPVLHSDLDSKIGSDSEKSQGTKTPSSDSDNKSDTEIKTTEITAKTEENSEASSGKSVNSEDASTESKSTTENEPSVGASDVQKHDSDESTDSIAAEIAASKIDKQNSNESQLQKRPYQYTLSASSIDYNKVPEADALKRSQIPLDTEVCLKLLFLFWKVAFYVDMKSFHFIAAQNGRTIIGNISIPAGNSK